MRTAFFSHRLLVEVAALGVLQVAVCALAARTTGCCSAVGCSGGVGGSVEIDRSIDELVGGQVRVCRIDDCRSATIERTTTELRDGGTLDGGVHCTFELSCTHRSDAGRESLLVTRDIGDEHPIAEDVSIEVTGPDGRRAGFRQGRVHYERESVGCDGDCSGGTLE